MRNPRLFMVLLGCKPKGRVTEQHDVFFGIAASLSELVPAMQAFWPDSGGLHIDAWREVTQVDTFAIRILPKHEASTSSANHKLFFINLGGYQANDFEELHHKLLVVAPTMAAAVKMAKQSKFYKDKSLVSVAGASHIDDKYGFEIDEITEVQSILSEELQQHFTIGISEASSAVQDAQQIGYLKLSKLVQ